MTLDDLSDRLNPVFLKETRQVFHNRTALGILALLLVAELIMHLIIVVNYSSMRESTLRELGLISYVIQQVMVGIAVLGVCVARATTTFAQERMQKEQDYSRISVISSSSIVLGKLMSQIVMMLDIYAIAMPFMFIAYFLRGISIPQMLGWTMILIPAYILMMQIGFLAASFGKKNAGGGIVLLSYLMGQILVPILIAIFDISDMSSTELWFKILCGGVGFAFFSLMLYSLTIAVINSFGNRMYWLRLLGMLQLLLLLVLNAVLYLFNDKLDWYKPDSFAELTGILSLVQFGISALVCLFERKEPGTRILSERPKGALRRAIRFLLSSGQASGLAFAWSYLCIWGLVIMMFLHFFPNDSEEFMKLWRMFVFAAYILFYIQSAMVLCRYFKRVKPEYAGIIVFFLLFAIPLLAASIVTFEKGEITDCVWLLLTTPICVFKDWPEIGILGLGFAFVTLLPFAKYILRSFERFLSDEKGVRA